MCEKSEIFNLNSVPTYRTRTITKKKAYRTSVQGCKSLLSIGGIISNFTPNLPFSTLGGMNLDHDFFLASKLSEEQKKGLHQKWNTFFPRIQVKTKEKDLHQKWNQARSQKFAMWGGANFGVWGQSLQRPKANGGWGYGQNSQPPEAQGSGDGAPALKNFAFFLQKKLNFRAILIKNNVF